MKEFLQKSIVCPLCGHQTQVELDATQGDQDYIEDCLSCGAPIHLRLHRDELMNRLQLFVDADDEQIF